MSKLLGKFVKYESSNPTLENKSGDGDSLGIKFDSGTMTSTASGLDIALLGVTNGMLTGSIASSKLADVATIGFLNQAETLAAIWDFSTFLPTASSNPTSDSQLVRKAYVDSIAAGLDVKSACRAATIVALAANTPAGTGLGKTLTANGNGILTIDGVTGFTDIDTDGGVNDPLSTSPQADRVLIKDQGSVDDGLYVVKDKGTAGTPWILVRAIDFDGTPANEVSGGNFTFIQEGTLADSGWVVTTDGIITVDTTIITFTQFSGAGQITAGIGLTKSGNTINVAQTGTTLTLAADSVDVNIANHLEDSSGLRIAATALGNGIKGGGASTLAIEPADFAGTGLEDDGFDNLRIAAAAAGNGITGGAGSALAIEADTVNTDLSDALSILSTGLGIDGDKLDIDFTPGNYTPDATIAEAADVNDLSAHLKGIDTKLSGLGTGDVSAAVVIADNAIVRGDGGAKGIQDSSFLLDDLDVMSILADGTVASNALTANGMEFGAGDGTTGDAFIYYDGTANELVMNVEGDNAASGSTGLRLDGQSYSAMTTLTDAVNIATDASNGNTHSVTLAGNRTLDNPTNMKDGATYAWVVTQDITGGRTLAFGTAFKFPGGVAPDLSSGASEVDIITAVSDGTSLFANIRTNNAISFLDLVDTVHAATHITGASDEIDGDQLDIDFTPVNYTPDTAPTEVSNVDHLSAHLKGIDNALINATGEEFIQEKLTVASLAVTLANTPLTANHVMVTVVGGLDQVNKDVDGITYDFVISGTTVDFDDTGGASGDIINGDEVIVTYFK